VRFVIVTGLSGAGKTYAVRVLEDMGYFVVDNMLPAMLTNFAELLYKSHGKMDKVAVVCDVRSGDHFYQLSTSLDKLTANNYDYEILFLDAKDNYLINRYKETRRQHPFSDTALLSEAIAQERDMLENIKKRATYIIDTSARSQKTIKKELEIIFGSKTSHFGIIINVVSFGFKYGLPLDCDLVFDVRFLPNPYYIPELKNKNGTEKEIIDFVMKHPQTGKFLKKLEDMLDYLLPFYEEEGKSQLVIGIGCTGGKHRSVAIAEKLYEYLTEENKDAYLNHREKDRWIKK